MGVNRPETSHEKSVAWLHPVRLVNGEYCWPLCVMPRPSINKRGGRTTEFVTITSLRVSFNGRIRSCITSLIQSLCNVSQQFSTGNLSLHRIKDLSSLSVALIIDGSSS